MYVIISLIGYKQAGERVMKRDVISRTIFVLCCVMSLVCFTQVSATDKYKLKRLKVEGVQENEGADVWVRTPSATIVFMRDYDSSTETYSLKSYRIESNGSTSVPVTYAEVPHGYVLRAKSVWLEDEKTGYVFFPLLTASGDLIFKFMEFDSNGNPAKPEAKILLTMKPEGIDNIQNGSLAVAVGKDRIAVVMNANYLRRSAAYIGFQKTLVQYAEVDFDGKIITSPRTIQVENGGLRREAHVQDAAWNGKIFLVPITFVRYIEKQVGSQIYGYSISTVLHMHQIASGAKSAKSQQLVVNVVENFGSTISDVRILAPYGTTPSGKKSIWYVIYSMGTRADNPETNVFIVNITHWTQGLNGKGKKIGAPRQVKAPKWHPRLVPTPGKLRINVDLLSDPLPLSNGLFLVAQVLGVREADYSGGIEKDVFDNELRLLTMDPKNGAVKLLSLTKPNFKLLFSETPLVDRFGKGYAVLNGGLTLGQSTVQVIEYLSRFKSTVVP